MPIDANVGPRGLAVQDMKLLVSNDYPNSRRTIQVEQNRLIIIANRVKYFVVASAL